jgi:spermidine/putrescine transport system substrate-binding protein
MRLSLSLLAGAALTVSAQFAQAAGELHIYNWGNYTSPAMIAKFEKQYDVKVTISEYDSVDTALAKIQAGGHGFDMVVPTQNYIPIFIERGLLLEARPDQMSNFKNVVPMFVKSGWDPENHYVSAVNWPIGLSIWSSSGSTCEASPASWSVMT